MLSFLVNPGPMSGLFFAETIFLQNVAFVFVLLLFFLFYKILFYFFMYTTGHFVVVDRTAFVKIFDRRGQFLNEFSVFDKHRSGDKRRLSRSLRGSFGRKSKGSSGKKDVSFYHKMNISITETYFFATLRRCDRISRSSSGN